MEFERPRSKEFGLAISISREWQMQMYSSCSSKRKCLGIVKFWNLGRTEGFLTLELYVFFSDLAIKAVKYQR